MVHETRGDDDLTTTYELFQTQPKPSRNCTVLIMVAEYATNRAPSFRGGRKPVASKT